jgi:hypothetical protein
MSEYRQHWPVAVMGEALGVSRSGYDDYVKTPAMDALTDDLELVTRLRRFMPKRVRVMAVVGWRKRFQMRAMRWDVTKGVG